MSAQLNLLGYGATSQGRQSTPFGMIGTRRFHHQGHRDCIIGGNHNINAAKRYINSIVPLEVLSIPGLDMGNWNRKTCKQEDYLGKTLFAFVAHLCTLETFSGTLVLFLLGNDTDFFNQDLGKSARDLVKEYITRLGEYLSQASDTRRLKLVILNTVLFRQTDFYENAAFRPRKSEFNKELLKLKNSPGFTLTINGRPVPYEVVDLEDFLPEGEMKGTRHYCEREVRYLRSGRPGRDGKPYRCVHVKAKPMETFLYRVRDLHNQFHFNANLVETVPVSISASELNTTSIQAILPATIPEPDSAVSVEAISDPPVKRKRQRKRKGNDADSGLSYLMGKIEI